MYKNLAKCLYLCTNTLATPLHWKCKLASFLFYIPLFNDDLQQTCLNFSAADSIT